jgi:hypothetical protein
MTSLFSTKSSKPSWQTQSSTVSYIFYIQAPTPSMQLLTIVFNAFIRDLLISEVPNQVDRMARRVINHLWLAVLLLIPLAIHLTAPRVISHHTPLLEDLRTAPKVINRHLQVHLLQLRIEQAAVHLTAPKVISHHTPLAENLRTAPRVISHRIQLDHHHNPAKHQPRDRHRGNLR